MAFSCVCTSSCLRPNYPSKPPPASSSTPSPSKSCASTPPSTPCPLPQSWFSCSHPWSLRVSQGSAGRTCWRAWESGRLGFRQALRLKAARQPAASPTQLPRTSGFLAAASELYWWPCGLQIGSAWWLRQRRFWKNKAHWLLNSLGFCDQFRC